MLSLSYHFGKATNFIRLECSLFRYKNIAKTQIQFQMTCFVYEIHTKIFITNIVMMTMRLGVNAEPNFGASFDRKT